MEKNNKEVSQTDNQLRDLITMSTTEQPFYWDEESFETYNQINDWGEW